MEKKILVNSNEIQAGRIVDEALTTAQTINTRLIPALEAIGQTTTNEVLKDCLLGATETKKAYFAGVEQDIKATRTPSIRKQMQEAAADEWDRFERELFNIRRETRQSKFLTIENGNCTLTRGNEEKLRDSQRIYLTDPKEIEAYKLHVEVVEKLNQLFKGQPPFRWTNIFPIDNTGKISRNDETDYSKLV